MIAQFRDGPWTGERREVVMGVHTIRVQNEPENWAYVYVASKIGEGGEILESYYDWKRYYTSS